MDVRRFEPRDREAVLALADRLQEGVASWRNRDRVAAAIRGWVLEAIEAPEDGRALFVAEEDEAVIGFATVTSSRHWTGDVDCYIGELAVDRGAERRGAGRALIAAAEDWGRRSGFERITLQTGAANDGARRFYVALGYAEEEVKLSKALRG